MKKLNTAILLFSVLLGCGTEDEPQADCIMPFDIKADKLNFTFVNQTVFEINEINVITTSGEQILTKGEFFYAEGTQYNLTLDPIQLLKIVVGEKEIDLTNQIVLDENLVIENGILYEIQLMNLDVDAGVGLVKLVKWFCNDNPDGGHGTFNPTAPGGG